MPLNSSVKTSLTSSEDPMSNSQKRTLQLAQQQGGSSGNIELLHAAVLGLNSESDDLVSASVATALRSALRTRSSKLPEAWRESASSLSIIDIDAFICHLGAIHLRHLTRWQQTRRVRDLASLSCVPFFTLLSMLASRRSWQLST